MDGAEAGLPRRQLPGARRRGKRRRAAAGKAFAAVPTGAKLHGLSAFGDLKYKPDFTHLDYVNVDAPQGGTFQLPAAQLGSNQTPLTFNTLNSFVPKGDSPLRMEMCFDSLMVRAFDEPDAVYGLIADGVTISDDRTVSPSHSLRPQNAFPRRYAADRRGRRLHLQPVEGQGTSGLFVCRLRI